MTEGPDCTVAVAEAARLLAADARRLTTLVTDQLLREVPSLANVPSGTLDETVHRNVVRAVESLRSRRAPATCETQAVSDRRELARWGVPAADAIRVYRTSIGFIQTNFVKIATDLDAGADEIMNCSTFLWRMMDVFTEDTDGTFRDAQQGTGLFGADERVEFLRRILFGSMSPVELARSAAAFGLIPNERYQAVRARPAPRTTCDQIRRQLESTGRRRGGTALIGVLDDDCIGVVQRYPALAVDQGLVGIGPAHRLYEIERSFLTASRVLDVATRYGRSGVCGLADLSWRMAVAAEEEIGDVLIRRYLSPLRAEGPETAELVQRTLRAYLDAGMSISKCAAQLSIHVNTLRYRLRRFEELTGASLKSINTVVEIAWVLEAALICPSPR